MSIDSIIVIVYFTIGFVLTLIWWNDAYKVEYEYYKAIGEVDESMVVLLLLGLFFFWPIKVIKDLIESFLFE